MRKNRQIALLERLLGVVSRGTPEASCRESHVEIDRYTSAERLEAERRCLFRKLPIVVGREEDLPEDGSFFTHDAAGVPLIVTREGGRVRAMLNVCRHRGTRLVCEASGTAKAFVCRYHAWTYDLAGRLGHVPLARTFPSLDREQRGLVEVPCMTRHGFVWVVPSADASMDLAAWLGDFDDDLASFELASHVVLQRRAVTRAANWKLVMDAFLEGYHVKSLHQRTLARFFREDVVFDTSGPHVRSLGARRNLLEIENSARDAWDVRQHTTLFYNVFPNTVLVFHPELVTHLALFPKAIDQVEIVHTMLAPRAPKDDEERAAWQRTWDLIDGQVFSNEDYVIAENIQSALAADAQRTFLLSALEYPIRVFHDQIDLFVAGS